MEIAKRYFKYRLKSIARPLLIMIAALLIFSAIYLSEEQVIRGAYYDGNESFSVTVNDDGYFTIEDYSIYDGVIKEQTVILDKSLIKYVYADSALGFPITILVIMSMIAPVWSFTFFKKRRNLDCCYSLPISRRALGVVHWIIGLLTVFLPFLASSLQTLIMLALKTPVGYSFFEIIHIEYVFAYFAVAFVGMLVLYSLYTFAFNEANTVSDGIIFIVFYNFVVMLLVWLADESEIIELGIRIALTLPIKAFSVIISRAIDGVEFGDLDLDIPFNHNSAWIILWIVVGFACAMYFFFSFGTRKTEKAEEISDSYFGYRTLIPFFGFSLLYISGIDYWDTNLVFTIISVLLYTVYRRGVKYKVSDIAVMGIMLFLTLIAFATS